MTQGKDPGVDSGTRIAEKAKMARAAALKLANATTAEKNKALLRIADSIDKNRRRYWRQITRILNSLQA